MADEITEKAIGMGWAPKEEFKGDESKWVDAEEFVRKGEEIVPILKERLAKQSDDLREVRGTLKKQQDTMNEFVGYYKKVEDRSYKKAIADLKKKQEQAVENGDVTEFKRIDTQIDEIEKGQEDPPAQPRDPVFDDWVSKNDWYMKDYTLHLEADKIGEFYANQGLLGTPLYDKVRKVLEEKFPQKFNKPAVPHVASATRKPQKPEKRGFSNLPAEAQQQCKRFMSEIEGFTEDEYLKHYEWDE